MKKFQPVPKLILRFIGTAIILYALFYWAWSYTIPFYSLIVTSVTNEELHILGLDAITKTGPSFDPKFDIAVYHRDAAEMQDSLFDFKLESLRSIMPMLLALLLAMPVNWKKKIKPIIPGTILVILVESLGCLLILSWSYIFLPDHNKFSPFHTSHYRESIIGFFYEFYNSVGIEFFPILIWIIVSVRKDTIRHLFKPMTKQ